MTDKRTETDTFGPIEVAGDRYWGAQAQRSLGNFKIGWEKQPVPVVRALNTVNIGMGFEAGLVIVLVAILLDRFLRSGEGGEGDK